MKSIHTMNDFKVVANCYKDKAWKLNFKPKVLLIEEQSINPQWNEINTIPLEEGKTSSSTRLHHA